MSGPSYAPYVRYQPDPVRVAEGDRLDGWEFVAAPGHADGQLCLSQGRTSSSWLTTCSVGITPTVGLWPESRPNPLARLPRFVAA